MLGWNFRNQELLAEALTTPSCRQSSPEARDNQRLEFLGDAVLGMLSADRLFAELPQVNEGELTIRRTHLVSTAALCAAAERHGLANRLRFAKGLPPPPANSKIYADAIEALIGAAWLDGGVEAAKTVFDALELELNAEKGSWSENPKGDLQIKAQAMRPPRHPEYRLIQTEGPAHDPRFTVEVAVEGLGSACATAKTRKEAECEAARQLL